MRQHNSDDLMKKMLSDDDKDHLQAINNDAGSVDNNSGGRDDNDRKNDLDDMIGQDYQKMLNLNRDQGQKQKAKPVDGDEISLHDIQSHLCSKNTSILTYKKVLQTILQYVHVFQVDQLSKFVRLVVDLASFPNIRNHSGNIIQPNNFELPGNGMQTIIQSLIFLKQLVDKACSSQNQHMVGVLKQIFNSEATLYCIPMKVDQFMQQLEQFLQNAITVQQGPYKTLNDDIFNSMVMLFEYQQSVQELSELFYFILGNRCRNEIETDCCSVTLQEKQSLSDQEFIKKTLARIYILSALNGFSSKGLFARYKFGKIEQSIMKIQKSRLAKLSKNNIEKLANAIYEFSFKAPDKLKTYISPIIEELTTEESSIDKKSFALKLIDKMVQNSKVYPQTIPTVYQILQQRQFLQKFLKDQTHHQLLLKLPPLLRFLYEMNQIDTETIARLTKESLVSGTDFHKVISQMVGFLKLDHLEIVFNQLIAIVDSSSVSVDPMLSVHFIQLMRAIVQNCNLMCSSVKPKRKHEQSSEKESKIPTSEIVEKQNQAQGQRRQQKIQIQTLMTEKLDKTSLQHRIFMFLLERVEKEQPNSVNSFIHVLNKHISNHIIGLLEVLQKQLQNRLFQPRGYKPFLLSIIQNCLKINNEEFKVVDKKIQFSLSSSVAQIALPHGSKLGLIHRLAVNCNLYDSLIIVLCRQRFNRQICERCLNILILITKNYKPLEDKQIQQLWNVLAMKSRNQTERQQFFQFIKEILKNNKNITEDGVKFIYFDIMLSLHYQWFTPKIYECLEILFMRINEDMKLLQFEDNMYNILGTQFIGIQKFYYLYFWADQKVSKKVKQFLLKLYAFNTATISIRHKLSVQVINYILQYIQQGQKNILQSESEQNLKDNDNNNNNKSNSSQKFPFCAQNQADFQIHKLRTFELINKFLEQSSSNKYKITDEAQADDNKISISINNVTRQALPPLKKNMQVNSSITLKDLIDIVSQQINPPLKKIELVARGKPLKVMNITLKQLKIQSNMTIQVNDLDDEPIETQQMKKQIAQNKQMLIGIFGEQHSEDFLTFVAEKYIGERIDRICELVMDEGTVKQLNEQFQLNQTEKIQEKQLKQLLVSESVPEQRNLSFSQLLSKELVTFLKIINQKQPKTSQKQWAIIRKIQPNLVLLQLIEKQINSKTPSWKNAFQSCLGSKNEEIYCFALFCKILKGKQEDLARVKMLQQTPYSFSNFVLARVKKQLQCNPTKQCSYQLIAQCFQLYNLISIMPNIQLKKQKYFKYMHLEIEIYEDISKFNEYFQQTNELNLTEFQKIDLKRVIEALLSFSESNVANVANQLLKHCMVYSLRMNNKRKQKQKQDLKKEDVHKDIKVIGANDENIDTENFFANFSVQNVIFLSENFGEMFVKFYLTGIILEVVNNNVEMSRKQKSELFAEKYQQLKSYKLFNRNNKNNKNNYQHNNIQTQLATTTATTLINIKKTQSKNDKQLQWVYYLMITFIKLSAMGLSSSSSSSSQSKKNNPNPNPNSNSNPKEQPNTNTSLLTTTLKNDLICLINLVINQYQDLQKSNNYSELIGIFGLIKTVLTYLKQELFMADKQTIKKFIDWLTEQFIFSSRQVLIITNVQIKEEFYDILTILCENYNEMLCYVSNKLISFGYARQRNHMNDTIDFRTNDFVGIQNLGSTCYINSLIQQLYHTKLPLMLLQKCQGKRFTQSKQNILQIEEQKQENEKHLKNNENLFELNHTFVQLFKTVKNIINIRPMIQQVKFYGDQIIPTVQQDTQEFLMSLLNYIEVDCGGKHIIDKIFGGSYSEELTYIGQGQYAQQTHKKYKQEHFYNITLDIKGKKTLNEALINFFRSQMLDDKIYCQEFQTKTTVIKKSFIKQYPSILIFTLKRFEFDVETMTRSKLNDYLQFPMDLDLSDYSLRKSSEKSQEKPQSEQQHCYKLSGVLIHSGSAQTGHYYSYIKRQQKWYEFNDRVVTEINFQDRIKGQCFGGTDGRTKNAYMLFYEKQASVLTQESVLKPFQMNISNIAVAQNQKLSKTDTLRHKNKMQIQNLELEHERPSLLHGQQNGTSQRHHGIFLGELSSDNYFMKLVQSENELFIKERLIYDIDYRKFINRLANILYRASAVDNQSSLSSQLKENYQMILQIKALINPRVFEPIVHYSNQNLMNQNAPSQQEKIISQVNGPQMKQISDDQRFPNRSNDLMDYIDQEDCI